MKQSSALKNLAIEIAVASEPPLPRVVILLLLEIPWNPVIIGIPPEFTYFKISFLLIDIIRDDLWSPLVIFGICQERHDRDFSPIFKSAPDNSAQAICSPEDKRTSYSNLSKFLLICFDFLI